MCVANYKLLSIYLPNGFFKATICVIHSVYTFVHNYNKTGEIFRPPYFMGKEKALTKIGFFLYNNNYFKHRMCIYIFH